MAAAAAPARGHQAGDVTPFDRENREFDDILRGMTGPHYDFTAHPISASHLGKLPGTTISIRCPHHSEYTYLALLQPREAKLNHLGKPIPHYPEMFLSLRELFVPHIVSRNDDMDLTLLTQVTKLEIPLPLHGRPCMKDLPPNVQYLTLIEGSILDTERLPDSLRRLELRGVKVSNAAILRLSQRADLKLILRDIDSINEDCINKDSRCQSITLIDCHNVNRGRFMTKETDIQNRTVETPEDRPKGRQKV
jgi:hypothetical protein